MSHSANSAGHVSNAHHGLGAPASPMRQTHLDAILSRLADTSGNLRSLEHSVHDMHDRAFGAEPMKEDLNGCSIQPGIGSAINHRIDEIDHVIKGICEKVDRLSGFV